jgi:hypothetical protein
VGFSSSLCIASIAVDCSHDNVLLLRERTFT